MSGSPSTSFKLIQRVSPLLFAWADAHMPSNIFKLTQGPAKTSKLEFHLSADRRRRSDPHIFLIWVRALAPDLLLRH